jgi:transketolase
MLPVAVDVHTLCINVLRGLAMDAVQKANSGHPGMPMGAAPMAYALWTRHLRHDPKAPDWPDRDRFVLSAGHGSMLLYGLLHLTGYDVSLDDLRSFRQWGGKTPGHPENHLTPGVEMATGPLGQGFATAVGFAMAERFLSARYGQQVVDHRTYVLCSDGDLMEGISQEAASFAGHQGLGKLIALYDDNAVTIDGSTDLAFSDDTIGRFRALGWGVWECDGMDADAVDRCLSEAKADTGRPSLIACRTVIGYGSPNKAGKSSSHGAPLGPDEVRLAKAALGLPDQEFWVPDEARRAFVESAHRAAEAHTAWQSRLADFRASHPTEAAELEASLAGRLPAGWARCLPGFEAADATRNASGQCLNAIAAMLPTFLSGCADLAESVKTHLKGAGEASRSEPTGRNVAYGVREHAMAACVNGMTLHGGVRAIGGTFLIFSDYCRPSLRLAALMECPSAFAFSHDSIGLGEDGPTHQPVEQAMSLRMVPNFNVFRPCDGNETAAAWKTALESKQTPTAVLLTRQSVPVLSPKFDGSHPAERGGYVLREASSTPRLVLVATGSEVALAVEAQAVLEAEGVPTRVVSLPSWFLFERQDVAYRSSVLPDIPTVSIEAGTTLGWARYAQAHVGLDHFGASAPAGTLFREFGFTVENLVATAKRLLG